MACTGEVCRLCGAGLWNRDPDRNCEHDVIDRHQDGLAQPAAVSRLRYAAMESSMLTTADVAAAFEEIVELGKSDAVIQHETARKWAARAVVCYRLFAQTGDGAWSKRAEDYSHEAIEHAAFAGDSCSTLLQLKRDLEHAARDAGV